MRIRLRPPGRLTPGAIVDLPADAAALLLEAGLAELADRGGSPVETAIQHRPLERAVLRGIQG